MSRLGPVTESFIGLEKLPEERYEITKTGVRQLLAGVDVARAADAQRLGR